MSKTKLIRISSRDAGVNETDDNFTVHLSQQDQSVHEVVGISLVGAIIPNKVYNVNKNNNILIYDVGGGDVMYTLPIGIYTVNTLINALNIEFLGNVIVTQDVLTDKLIFTTDGVTTLTLYYINDRPVSKMSDLIGLSDTLIIAPATGLPLQHLPSLNGLDAVLIHSATLGQGNTLSSSQRGLHVIAMVPIRVPFGFNEVYDESIESSKIIMDYPRNVETIDIRITDQHNQSLNLNGEVDLFIRIYY